MLLFISRFFPGYICVSLCSDFIILLKFNFIILSGSKFQVQDSKDLPQLPPKGESYMSIIFPIVPLYFSPFCLQAFVFRLLNENVSIDHCCYFPV